MTSAGQEHLRDQARSSLRWAKLVVALGLMLVLLLALAGVTLGWKAAQAQNLAENERHHAEEAEVRAELELQRAYLAEARGQRLGNTLARRGATLDVVRRAVALQPSAALRDESVAALALPELRPESSFVISKTGVRQMAFAPDLTGCAEGRQDGDVVLRKSADGERLRTLSRADGGIPEAQGGAVMLEYSLDGRMLAVRYEGGALAIWDLASGRLLMAHDADAFRHLIPICRFSSDSRFVIGPVFSPVNGLAVMEVATGRVVATHAGISQYKHVAVRPGTSMFAVNSDAGVSVVDWHTMQPVASFDFPAGCRTINWSADGRQLAIGGDLLEVHVWDFASRSCRVLSGHGGEVNAAVFDDDGTHLATTATDGLTRVWDLTQGRLLGVMAAVTHRLGADGRAGVETADGRLEVRRIVPSPVYRRCQGGKSSVESVRSLDVSPDGLWAASVVKLEGIQIWNLNTGGPPAWFPHPGIECLCFDPAGARLFAGRGNGLSIHDWKPGSPPAMIETPAPASVFASDVVNLMAVSCDGSRIARGNLGGGRMYTAPLNGSAPPRRINGGLNSTVRSCGSPRGSGAFSLSPDGKWFACGTGGADGVCVFDSASGELIKRLSGPEGYVQFSPDGRWLGVSRSGQLQVLRAGTWEMAWEHSDLPRFAPSAAAFSPDGAMLAAPNSANTVALWDAATGQRLVALEAPDAMPVSVLRWSADGSRLLCGTSRQEVDVWEIPALARELSAMGLGWEHSFVPRSAPAVASAQQYPFQWLAAGVLVAGGGAAGLAVFSLRRHRRLIEEIAQGEALAEAAGRELRNAREISDLRSSFVSMVSHEFRTPLAVILSSTDILSNHLDRLSPERRAQQLAGIRGSTQQMARLIEEVLLLGKVEAGKMSFAPAVVPLRTFCSELVDEALSATARRCPISLHCEADLPESIQADSALLRHVFSNLLSNASKYSPEGAEVSLHVATVNGALLFRVTDQGIGIPIEDQPRIFEAFHRAKNVGQVSGTGLGLMITKRCVELHGGSIALHSAPGAGTTVEVAIPATPVDFTPDPPPP